MDHYEFFVQGKPEPAGSKNAFLHRHTGRLVVTDDNPKSRGWKKLVKQTAMVLVGAPRLSVPVELRLTFVVERPQHHYRTGRNAHLLRDAAPDYHTVKPDTTKLIRGVEDALTGVLWVDDAQVVRQSAEKVYGSPAGVLVRVTPLVRAEPAPQSLLPEEALPF